MNSLDILEKLVAFDSVSRNSNLDLIEYVEHLLRSNGVVYERVYNEDRTKANLLAKTQPVGRQGFLLSGHSDVVPVDGQSWSTNPFRLTDRNGRLFGRGTTDMKGFLACALHATIKAAKHGLQTPLWLAISYDEEVGCIGVRRLIDEMKSTKSNPIGCIVGEPTSMEVGTGHKGKTVLQAKCIGRSAHSAFAPHAVNALHLACDFVQLLRDEQSNIQHSGILSEDFDIPYSTLHAHKINGGIAANIVPNEAAVEFEIRNIPTDDPESIINKLELRAGVVAEGWRRHAEEADISIESLNAYPGLGTKNNSAAAAFVNSLTNGDSTCKLAFGTEAGLFADLLCVPTVVCGPGSIAQAHRPDEFIARTQLQQCDKMLDALLDRLKAGIPPLK